MKNKNKFNRVVIMGMKETANISTKRVTQPARLNSDLLGKPQK